MIIAKMIITKAHYNTDILHEYSIKDKNDKK